MTAWSSWHPHSGSLRGFLLRWLLGGVWLIVACFTMLQAGVIYQRRADVQDTWLRHSLDLVARQMEREPLVIVPHWASSPRQTANDQTAALTYYRVTALNGSHLAGDTAWAPFPWRASLSASSEAALYFSQVEGTLVRAIAAQRPLASEGKPIAVVLQLAAPWRERVPGWRELMIDSPLLWLYANAMLLSVLILAGVTIAWRWLDRTRHALEDPTEGDDHDGGPSELQATVQRMRQLRQDQIHWVERQRRFLADASHQLRTPMAVLRTQLQSAIAGDAAAAVLLPQMLHTVDRATGLANQLLSLTKLEQLKHTGGLQPVNLYAAARDAVMELSPLIAAKRLDFVLEGPELNANGEPVMLGELLRNLLANAIHHAPTAGRLGVLLRANADRLELVVWDEGPGVDNDVQARLFQPFSASVGGVGLGLSICKQIAEAMGASVDLYNRVSNGRVIGVDAVVAWAGAP